MTSRFFIVSGRFGAGNADQIKTQRWDELANPTIFVSLPQSFLQRN
jgi:hypothetical protein